MNRENKKKQNKTKTKETFKEKAQERHLHPEKHTFSHIEILRKHQTGNHNI